MNFGVGLSDWGIPVYLGLDYAAIRNVSLGGEVSYRSYRENWMDAYYRHSIVGISVNGNYHFNSLFGIPSTFDLYAGPNIGFYTWSSPVNYKGSHSSGLDLGAQVGGRYFFTNNVAINLEGGGGNAFSGGKLGLTIKL